MERGAIQEAARQSKEPETDVHSDFSPGQLLLMNKGQIGVIDFDLASLGDPAFDVGNFMAQLHYKALSKASKALRQIAADFLSEYQARLSEQRVGERVPLFLSTSLVRRALRAFEIRPYDYCGRADPDSPMSPRWPRTPPGGSRSAMASSSLTSTTPRHGQPAF